MEQDAPASRSNAFRTNMSAAALTISTCTAEKEKGGECTRGQEIYKVDSQMLCQVTTEATSFENSKKKVAAELGESTELGWYGAESPTAEVPQPTVTTIDE